MTKTKKVTVSTTTGNLRRMRRYGRKKRYNDPWSTEIHKYKRTTFNEIDVSASNALHFANSGFSSPDHFSLDKLPNYTEFTALYDMYRIDKVKLTFMYSMNSAAYSASNVACLPVLVYVNDYDDGTPLSTGADYLEYGNVKKWRLDKPLTLTVKPKVSMAIWNSAITTGYSTPKRNPFIDCANYGTPHYGIKFMIDPVNPIPSVYLGKLRLYMTYYLTLKGTR